jgi:hypothetical protein
MDNVLNPQKNLPTYGDDLEKNLENPGFGCDCCDIEIALVLKNICLQAIVFHLC